ncbi:MAG: asparaginase [Anaerolineales bacterium]|nr:asparaginase [Anaerolineales bacterium]MCS7248272.1 asparaginase [Anaerolineales bacterium]MDW8162086.1 asparaginase [Anaerolineales bacterium]MDW8448196.1 asparaginase [Anaerolineales bacterium]
MPQLPYQPLYELCRGDFYRANQNQIPESVHFGAIAVVDAHGKLIASYGDPYATTYLRSCAKPFQALPLVESGASAAYGLNDEEIALICSSHSGCETHVTLIRRLQEKCGVQESDLLCGVHYPLHEETARLMRQRGEKPSANHHNCSGKHTGMIALARFKNLPSDDYINPKHPIQTTILAAFAEMCRLAPEQVQVGTDGCSAPNFAVPLYHVALAYARLCDPLCGEVYPPQRAEACRRIAQAMMSYPELVGGPGRFDTHLMRRAEGKILAKTGAEGYQGLGLMPGVLGTDSPGIGVALKVADGDQRGKVSAAVSLEVLRQLGALTEQMVHDLSEFGPSLTLKNFRQLPIGTARPIFSLQWHS